MVSHSSVSLHQHLTQPLAQPSISPCQLPSPFPSEVPPLPAPVPTQRTPTIGAWWNSLLLFMMIVAELEVCLTASLICLTSTAEMFLEDVVLLRALDQLKLSRLAIYLQESPCAGYITVSWHGKGVGYFCFTIIACARKLYFWPLTAGALNLPPGLLINNHLHFEQASKNHILRHFFTTC